MSAEKAPLFHLTKGPAKQLWQCQQQHNRQINTPAAQQFSATIVADIFCHKHHTRHTAQCYAAQTKSKIKLCSNNLFFLHQLQQTHHRHKNSNKLCTIPFCLSCCVAPQPEQQPACAYQPCRKERMGVHQWQRPHKNRRKDKVSVLVLPHRTVKQPDCTEQNCITKQRCALWQQNVRNDICPADVMIHKVCRCGVKSREYIFKFKGASVSSHKIHKSKAAVQQQHQPRSNSLRLAIKHSDRQQINTAAHLKKCRQHRQDICPAQ